MMERLVARRCGRQLITVAAVLFGATLLLTALAPQEAHSQGKNATQEAQTEEQESTRSPQKKERVRDKDPKGNEVASGELLVTYKEQAPEEAKREAPEQIGGQVEEDFEEIEVQHISVPEVKDEPDQQAREETLEQKKEDLEHDPEVEAVDYNYVREGSIIPTDPDYAKQWALSKINAPGAWDFTRGSTSAKVAIFDSGIDQNHPDIKGEVAYYGGQKDFVDNDGVASDDIAVSGHGTLVAGIEGASINNRAGVVGTCPDCRLLNARVLDQNNKGTDDRYIAGIGWATSNGANVINMSFGGYGRNSALEAAINNAWNSGVVLVGAVGNDGKTGPEFYPAAYPNVIAVAATESNDKRAYYEWTSGTYFDPPGKYMGASNAGPWVDVAAPGKEILTTARTYYSSTCSCYPANVATAWGTSMAAPHVSGLAGLLFSQGNVTNPQVRKKIQDTAKYLGTAGKDPVVLLWTH